jgi:hypothetical protein
MKPQHVESLEGLSLAKHHFNPGQRDVLEDYSDLEERLSVKK